MIKCPVSGQPFLEQKGRFVISNEVKGLQQIVVIHKRRLQRLREQEALYGLSADPHISIEIQDIEAKITYTEEQIRRFTSNTAAGTPQEIDQGVTIEVQVGDVTLFNSDILALKFAQDLHGADEVVAELLGKSRYDIASHLPNIGDYALFESSGRTRSNQVLFVSVKELYDFTYKEIRDFSAKVLAILLQSVPHTKHLSMTIHGVGYGLDESEALRSQLAGYLDALRARTFPTSLQRITLVERNPERAARLSVVLNNTLPQNPIPIRKREDSRILSNFVEQSPIIIGAGHKSLSKPHVLVAIPSTKEMEDTFYYGIQAPVNAAGLLCESINFTSPSTEAIDRLINRISSTSLMVAEMSNYDPFTFLAIGYAYAKGKRTILLSKKFESIEVLKNQFQCVLYEKIRDVELAIKEAIQIL